MSTIEASSVHTRRLKSKNQWSKQLGPGGLDSWDFFEVGIAMKGVPRFEYQTTTIPNHQPEPLVPKNPERSLGGLGLIVPILSPDLFDLHLHPRSLRWWLVSTVFFSFWGSAYI